MTHQQHVEKYGDQQWKHKCECGCEGVHRFAGWECERCHQIRLAMEFENRSIGMRGNRHTQKAFWNSH